LLETMELTAIPAEDEALREPVRAFLREQLAEMPPAKRARSWMGFDRAFSKALAAKGWVGLTLPRDFGGGGRSQFARFVLVEELLTAGAPVAAHWIGERQSAPLLLRYGTEEQRRTIVPQVCRGEASFCIGMSEPDTGSDLASVRSRAEKTANGWRLNGSKIWTTFGHEADYMIALVRTSGRPEDRSAGLSQLLLPLKTTPGITTRPIIDLRGDAHFSEIHFEDAELPEDALIGEEGQGWSQVNAELAFERSGPERIYSSMVLVDTWLDFLRSRGTPSDAERELAGRLLGQVSALRNLSLAVTGRLGAGQSPVIEACVVKELGTTFEQAIPQLITDHLASVDGPVPGELLATLSYLVGMSPSFSLRGGTREILRGIIARGLGLR
jgi:alkylation response protein AidB-like acyl-CoA dehydrogenase